MNIKLIEEEAPRPVKVAAFLVVVAAVLEFLLRSSSLEKTPVESFQVNSWPWPQLISLLVSLMIAWLLVRLNSLAYWLTVITTGLGILVLPVSWAMAGFRPSNRLLVSTPVSFLWIESVLVISVFALLVLRASRKAPWSLSNGFSRL